MPRWMAGMVGLLVCSTLVGVAWAEDPVALVDPFIGTADGSSPDPPPGDTGGATFPGAAYPFGMVQWSPDTAPRAEFSYYYPDHTIKGFSVNHISGPGCPALLDFPMLPVTNEVAESPGQTLGGMPSPSATRTRRPSRATTG